MKSAIHLAKRSLLVVIFMALLPPSPSEAQVIAIQGILDGNLTIVSLRRDIQAIELKARESKFIPQNVREGLIQPPFDVAREEKLFALRPQGVRQLYFGNVLAPLQFAPFTIAGHLKSDGSGNNKIEADGFAVFRTPVGPGTALSMSRGLRSACYAIDILLDLLAQNVLP